MQIRLSRDLEGRVGVPPYPMTIEEFFARFPEVPRDLRDEPVLAEFVRAFGSQLRVAQKPSPCVAQAGFRNAEHHFYTRHRSRRLRHRPRPARAYAPAP